jgi:hypothetical protein
LFSLFKDVTKFGQNLWTMFEKNKIALADFMSKKIPSDQEK